MEPQMMTTTMTSPLQLGLDVLTLLIAIYVLWQASKAALGGAVGTAFQFILAGVFVLTINHLLDTILFSTLLKTENINFLQEPVVHRAINLIGFILMAVGFSNLPKLKR